MKDEGLKAGRGTFISLFFFFTSMTQQFVLSVSFSLRGSITVYPIKRRSFCVLTTGFNDDSFVFGGDLFVFICAELYHLFVEMIESADTTG